MDTTEKKIGKLSKVFLLISGIVLFVSIFTPIWRIELDAPQYPEGLVLLIYADKLGGNVDIINGLNHYIGMKTLHVEDFVEFKFLPYIIGFFALACMAVVLISKKKTLYYLVGAFILFGIVAMVDFWRWEYNYGHRLDPNAAIIVPGMAYQPPLIGFKQLLNFGAYSIPDIGGKLFIVSGLLMAITGFKEARLSKRHKRKKTTDLVTVLALLCLTFNSCQSHGPEAIKLNSDNCDNCGMTITDPKFAAELITPKGRVYKFDDISCMLNYKNDNKEKTRDSKFFLADFTGNNSLIPSEKTFLVRSEDINSPMGGNTAAFSSKDSADLYSEKYNVQISKWVTLNN